MDPILKHTQHTFHYRKLIHHNYYHSFGRESLCYKPELFSLVNYLAEGAQQIE